MVFLRKSTKIEFVLCIFFIFLVKVFTIEPTTISGNGNLGIFVFVPAVILVILFIRNLWIDMNGVNETGQFFKKVLIGVGVLFLLLTTVEIFFVLNLIEQLGGTPSNPESKIYRFGWFNQYTNTFYLNYYTFFMIVFGTVFIKFITKSSNK